eukprot:6048904-Ditylum_brightwellii.AAC.1
MKTAPTSKQSNPNVKQTVIAFQRPSPRQLKYGQCQMYKLRIKTLLEGDALMVFDQAENTHGNQTLQNFNLCLDGMVKHVFPEKAGQTQKCYMRRNIRFGGGLTVKEWVAQVLELTGYLKDFPVHNGNVIQPLDKKKLLDILEYRVPASWHRVFTVQ